MLIKLFSWQGRYECAKLLIEVGADVNKADNEGDTPLSMAAQNGHSECVKLLIAAGATESKKNTPTPEPEDKDGCIGGVMGAILGAGIGALCGNIGLDLMIGGILFITFHVFKNKCP